MTLTEADQTRRVAEAERRVDEANRRAANCRAAERRAEEVDQAERRAKASVVARRSAARPSQPKFIAAPTPAQRHTPKEIPVMSAKRQILFREVATTTTRLASARQSLEDAKLLARNGMADDGPIVFALHVEAGAFQACRD